MSAPRPRISGQGTGDGSLAGGLVGVDEDVRDPGNVRGLGEFADDRRVGVGQGQHREARADHEARVGRAESGSRKVVVAMAVFVGFSPTNLMF